MFLTRTASSIGGALQHVPTVSVLKERNSILETEKKELQAKVTELEGKIAQLELQTANLQSELHVARQENEKLSAHLQDLSSEPELDDHALRVVSLMAKENRRFLKHELVDLLKLHPTEVDYYLSQLSKLYYVRKAQRAPGRPIYYYLSEKGTAFVIEHRLIPNP